MNPKALIGGEMAELYSEILPGLYQGGTADRETIEHAQTLRYFDGDGAFDSIVTLYAWAAPANWGVEERRFGFPDAALDAANLPRIHALAKWAFAEWSSGRRVLVRCQAGLNRSGLVTALVLMHAGYSAEEAIELIRERRSPYALFNERFAEYLLSSQPFEYIVHESQSDSSEIGA
jgi:hypothetical protein